MRGVAEVTQTDGGEVRVGLSAADRIEIYEGGAVTVPHPTEREDIMVYMDRDVYNSDYNGFHIRPEADWPEMSTAVNGGRRWMGQDVRLYWQSPIITGKEPMPPEEVQRLIEANSPQ